MLDQEKVTAFIEQAEREMQRIDAEFERVKQAVQAQGGNFADTPEIKKEAEALLAEAKARAEEAGKNSQQPVDIEETKAAPARSFSRRRTMI